MQTGALLLPKFRNLERGELTLSYGEQTANLKFHLAYFDEVMVLGFNMVGAPLGAFVTSSIVEQELVGAGRLAAAVFDTIRIDGRFNAEAVSTLALQAYDFLNDGDRGRWAISAPSAVFEAMPSGEHMSLITTLSNCLPAPTLGVPVDELIDFRAANRAGLMQFRGRLDEIRMSLAGGDPERARHLLQTRLADDIAAAEEAFNRERIPFGRVGLKVMMSLPGILGPAADILLGTMSIGLPLGSLAGGAITTALISKGIGEAKNNYPPDYGYVVTGLKAGMLSVRPEDEPEFELRLNGNALNDIELIGGYPEVPAICGLMENCSLQNVHFARAGVRIAPPGAKITRITSPGAGATGRYRHLPLVPAVRNQTVENFARDWVARASARAKGGQ